MKIEFEGKDDRRARRRKHNKRVKERAERIVNVAGGYDDDPEGLQRAVVKRVQSETTGRRRLDANVLGGTIKRQKRDELNLQDATA
jgi:hypothetical protein